MYEKFLMLKPSDIVVKDGFNQRCDFGDIEGLAEQISMYGVLEPITVSELGNGKYLLQNGERRYRSVQYLEEHGGFNGLIKANVVEDECEEQQYVEQFIRNGGKGFNDVETGRLCKKIMECSGNYSRSYVAKKLGVKPYVVTYSLQSLNYHPDVVKKIEKGEISGATVRKVYEAHKATGSKNWEANANKEILGYTQNSKNCVLKKSETVKTYTSTKLFVGGIKEFLIHLANNEKLIGKNLSDIDVFSVFQVLVENPKYTIDDAIVYVGKRDGIIADGEQMQIPFMQ